MLSKFLLSCLLALSVVGAPSAIVPSRAKGDICIVQDQIGHDDVRLYFQPWNGDTDTGIIQYVVSGPFDTGRQVGPPLEVVPPGEVLQKTPISAAVLGNYQEFHLLFLSPERILSEVIWTPSTGLISGSRCPQCVTHKGYKVAPGQDGLSATYNVVTGTLSVAFVSAISPETISEAVWRSGRWVLAPFQDAN